MSKRTLRRKAAQRSAETEIPCLATASFESIGQKLSCSATEFTKKVANDSARTLYGFPIDDLGDDQIVTLVRTGGRLYVFNGDRDEASDNQVDESVCGWQSPEGEPTGSNFGKCVCKFDTNRSCVTVGGDVGASCVMNFNCHCSSPSVGAVSDAAPHPTVGDAPDRTATPSGGSGALSLEQRVSALEDDMRAVPALITESKRAHDLEHLIRLSTSSRRDTVSEVEAV